MTETIDHCPADQTYPKKLNVGCGWDKRPGYLNVDFKDFHEPDVVADIRDLNMLPEGYFEEVLAQDVLEHLPRNDALPALAEWVRVLAPGGVLRLRVPNVIGLLKLFEASDRQSREGQEALVQCLYGTQAYDGDWHCNGFTELLLRNYLAEIGCVDPSFTSVDEWLFDVTAVKAGPGYVPKAPSGHLASSAPQRALAGPLADDPAFRAALATADLHADFGQAAFPPTRLRALKAVVSRATRHLTHHQVAFNQAVLVALQRVADRDG